MSSRRRALLVLTLALLLAGLAWLASAMIGSTRLALDAGRDGGVRVTTDFPAATCSKTLSRAFPWVRFSCEAEEAEPQPGR